MKSPLKLPTALRKPKSLYLYMNQVSDVSPLENLTNLLYISLGKNKVTDITHLKKLSQLRGVDLAHNQIRDFSVLYQLENLGRELREERGMRAVT